MPAACGDPENHHTPMKRRIMFAQEFIAQEIRPGWISGFLYMNRKHSRPCRDAHAIEFY